MERFSRQTMLPEIGLEGQQRLLESAALIIGAGGLGSPVALYLAAAGVGRLGLCDTDTVSLSNLQRQILYSEEEIGRQKTECAARRLGALRSDLRCTLHPEGLNAENAAAIASGYDIVIDCCDNFATRYLIDDTCRALGKPWVHGTIGGFDGRGDFENRPLSYDCQTVMNEFVLFHQEFMHIRKHKTQHCNSMFASVYRQSYI